MTLNGHSIARNAFLTAHQAKKTYRGHSN